MSPAEVGYRFNEQLRRWRDGQRRFQWSDFDSPGGKVIGLPGLSIRNASAPVGQAVAEAAACARAGAFRFLNQDWPARMMGPPWWRSDIWTLDPSTGLHWPGADRFAFNSDDRRGGLGDPKFVWELNRLQFLPAMAMDAGLRNDAHALDETFDVVGGWMAANPPYQGINWTSRIELAVRIVSVLAAVALAPAEGLSPSTHATLRTFITAHAWWIGRHPSLHSSANNHRIAELVGLFLAGLCVPSMPSADRYASEAQVELERECRRQFHGDGIGAEQSLTYTAATLEWLVIAGICGDVIGKAFSANYRAVVAAGAESLRWMIDEGGHTPRIGDDDESRILALGQGPETRYVSSVVALADRWVGQPQPAMGLRDPALRDLLIPGGTTEALPPAGVRTFADGGYTVWRAERPAGLVLVAFDHGPLGMEPLAAHGHADALSIWLHYGDEPVLVDAGTFLYSGGGAHRDRFRGTQVHNTVAIDRCDQSRMAGPFNWSRKAKVRLIAASGAEVIAEHDGYSSDIGVVHRRAVELAGDALFVTDTLCAEHRAAGATWAAGFSLAPGVAVALDGARVRIGTPGGRLLTLVAEGASADWRLEEGEYSPAFGVRTVCPRLVLAGSVLPGERVVARVKITPG